VSAASRLEFSGIQISEQTYQRVKGTLSREHRGQRERYHADSLFGQVVHISGVLAISKGRSNLISCASFPAGIALYLQESPAVVLDEVRAKIEAAAVAARRAPAIPWLKTMKGAFGAVAEEGCLKTLIKTGHFGSTLLFYSRHRSLGTDELDGRQMNGIQRANENRKWLKGAPQDCRHISAIAIRPIKPRTATPCES
jgi:hypothetical protein